MRSVSPFPRSFPIGQSNTQSGKCCRRGTPKCWSGSHTRSDFSISTIVLLAAADIFRRPLTYVFPPPIKSQHLIQLCDLFPDFLCNGFQNHCLPVCPLRTNVSKGQFNTEIPVFRYSCQT